jgi:uncharacterized protein Yka (UPF0111/DUF47 family)
VFNFLPKDDKFFDQLDNLARILVNAAQQLSAILQTFPKFDAQRDEIEELRKKAAHLAQDSLAILDHAFITPLDREDILALIDGMNAVIQEIAELSERLGLYPLESLYPNLTAQSRHLLELAIQVEEIVADRKEFLRELFRDNSDPIELIKKKDLHDLLEEALSRMTRITQVLARVLLKNT